VAEIIVEESNKRRKRAASRIESSREVAAKISTRAAASVKEAVVAVSPQRQSLRREDFMGKLESTTWLGRVIVLQGLLGLVSKTSLSM
jgi:hypothetical protein